MSKIGKGLALLLSGLTIAAGGMAGGMYVGETNYRNKTAEIQAQDQTELEEMAENLESISLMLEERESELIALRVVNTSLEADKTSLQEEIATKQAAIASLNSQISELESQEQADALTIASLTSQKAALEADVATLESSVSSLNSQISTLQESISTLETSLSTAQSQLSSLQSDYAALQALYSSQTADVESLTGQIAVLQARIQELESSVGQENDNQVYLDSLFNLDFRIKRLNSGLTFAYSAVSPSSSSATIGFHGLYLVNNDFSLTQLYSIGCWGQFYELDNGDVLIGAISDDVGILYYDKGQNAVNKIYNVGTNWTLSKAFKLRNGNLLFGNTNSNVVFNPATYSITVVSGTFIMPSFFYEVSDTVCLLSVAANSPTGLYKYNSLNNEISQITSIGKRYDKGIVLTGGNAVLWGTNSATPCILYEVENDSVTSLNSTSGYTLSFKDTHDNIFFSSTSSSLTGIYVYISSSNTFAQVYSSGRNWSIFYELSNGDIFISAPVSTGGGLLKFSAMDNSVSQIYSQGYYYDTFVVDENGITISSSVNTSQSSLYYDFATGNVSVVS